MGHSMPPPGPRFRLSEVPFRVALPHVRSGALQALRLRSCQVSFCFETWQALPVPVFSFQPFSRTQMSPTTFSASLKATHSSTSVREPACHACESHSQVVLKGLPATLLPLSDGLCLGPLLGYAESLKRCCQELRRRRPEATRTPSGVRLLSLPCCCSPSRTRAARMRAELV